MDGESQCSFNANADSESNDEAPHKAVRMVRICFTAPRAPTRVVVLRHYVGVLLVVWSHNAGACLRAD